MTLMKLNSRSILSNITLLNILLVFCAAIFISLNIDPMFVRNFALQINQESSQEKGSNEGASELQSPSSSDYIIVGDNNLFHPERIIPPEKKEEKPLPKPEIVLYGTMISDDLKVAYVEDLKAPRNTPGRGRRQLSLYKGDELGGFVLKEISTDKIVMRRGEEVLTVTLYDSHKKPKSVAPPASTAAKPPQAAKNNQKPTVSESTKAMDQKAFQFFEKLKGGGGSER
jgi:hypothetical protein